MAGVKTNLGETQIQDKKVNLKEFPQINSVNPDEPKVVIKGDLHGNFLMLIHWLIEQNVVNLEGNENTFNDLVKFYYEDLKDYQFNNTTKNKELIKKFETFLSKIKKTDNKILVKLIGDVMADRGPCDFFTLMLTDHLEKQGMSFDVMLSNHDAWFIDYFGSLNRNDQPALINIRDQNNSLMQLENLRKTNPILTEKIKELSIQYLKHIKLIDYIREGDQVTLLTHATNHPMIVQETVAELNKLIDDPNKKIKYNNKKIKYNSDNLDEFCGTIDAINKVVQENQEILVTICENIKENGNTNEDNEARDNAFNCLTWLRAEEWDYFRGYNERENRYRQRVINFINSSSEQKRKTVLEKIKAIIHGHDVSNIAEWQDHKGVKQQTITVDSNLGKSPKEESTKSSYPECIIPISQQTYNKIKTRMLPQISSPVSSVPIEPSAALQPTKLGEKLKKIYEEFKQNIKNYNVIGFGIAGITTEQEKNEIKNLLSNTQTLTKAEKEFITKLITLIDGEKRQISESFNPFYNILKEKINNNAIISDQMSNQNSKNNPQQIPQQALPKDHNAINVDLIIQKLLDLLKEGQQDLSLTTTIDKKI